MHNFRPILVFILGLFVGFVFSFFFVQSNLKKTPENILTENVGASLMVDSGERIITCQENFENTNATVFDLLKNCSVTKNFSLKYQSYEGLGLLVNEIASAPSKDDKYWQYWVNNEYAEVSADNEILENGDVVLWKLTAELEE